jgi:hypothetical protein
MVMGDCGWVDSAGRQCIHAMQKHKPSSERIVLVLIILPCAFAPWRSILNQITCFLLPDFVATSQAPSFAEAPEGTPRTKNQGNHPFIFAA